MEEKQEMQKRKHAEMRQEEERRRSEEMARRQQEGFQGFAENVRRPLLKARLRWVAFQCAGYSARKL